MLGISGARVYFPQHRHKRTTAAQNDSENGMNNKITQRTRQKALSMNSNDFLSVLKLNTDQNITNTSRSVTSSPINLTVDTDNNNTTQQRSDSVNEAYVQSLTSPNLSTSYNPSINPDTQRLIELLSTVQTTVHTSDSTTLQQQLQQSTDAAVHILNELYALSVQVIDRLKALQYSEKQYSEQAGHLLKQLHVDEQLMSKLNIALRDTKSQRKKLLSNMTAPRWEVKHHYHMTVFEHSLGHAQPHVLDVAEMLPGHLRLYAISRIGALTKRTFSVTLNKAKQDRLSVTEQIKHLYKQLKETRNDIKHVNDLIDSIRSRVKQLNIVDNNNNIDHNQQILELQHKLDKLLDTRNSVNNQRINPFSFAAAAAHNNSVNQSFRSKYLASLNIAPVKFNTTNTSVNNNEHLHRYDVNESNWHAMHSLLGALESHSMSVKQMHERRRQIGIESLPSPRKLVSNDTTHNNNSTDVEKLDTDSPLQSPEFKSTDTSSPFNFDHLRLDDTDNAFSIQITPIDTPNEPTSAFEYKRAPLKSPTKTRSNSTKD